MIFGAIPEHGSAVLPGPFQVEGQQPGEQIVGRQVGRPAVGGEYRLVQPPVGVHQPTARSTGTCERMD